MPTQRNAVRIRKPRSVRLMNSPMFVVNVSSGGELLEGRATKVLSRSIAAVPEFTQNDRYADRQAPSGATLNDEPWAYVDPTVHLPIY